MRIVLLFSFLIACSITGLCQAKKLSVIGSSTAAGTGATGYDSSYVGRVEAYYDNLGIPTTVTNLALGGSNCYRGLPSSYFITPPPPPFVMLAFPDVDRNVTKALSFNPDVVIVGYPSNLYNTVDFTIPRILDVHQKIYDSVIAAGKVCFITTTQPRQDAGVFDTPESRQKLKDIRDAMMLQFGNYAIDFWTGIALPDNTINPIYSAGDNIHLNNAGHRELFRRVRNKDIFGIGLVNRATSSGNWENPAIWENGEIPTLADSVVILGGRTVTLNSNAEVRKLSVIQPATFTVSSSRLLKIGN
ncbi:MAG TPA: SGNH/GDSL hydrolase family protein [Chitinophagaceae bacterium]|nr:SGNH/GDSL hydrolase family protein [Chitinophagaceae bacterium]